NKQALIFAVLTRHLDMLAEAIEKACEESRNTTLQQMAEAVVKAYLAARMSQSEAAPALYHFSVELESRQLTEQAMLRSERAIEAMLSTASDGNFADPHVIAQTLTAAIYGTVPAFCERAMPPAIGCEAERQLTKMFHAYLVVSGVVQ